MTDSEPTGSGEPLASSFGALRRHRQPGDALPAAAITTVTGGASAARHGINQTLSRLAGEPEASKVWLVPGASGSCMYDGQSGGAVFAANDAVRTQGLALLLVPVSGAQPTLVGVVPDGATVTAIDASGSTTRVAISGAAFRVTGYGGGHVTIHASAGDSVLSIPSPSPAPPGPDSLP